MKEHWLFCCVFTGGSPQRQSGYFVYMHNILLLWDSYINKVLGRLLFRQHDLR